MHLRENISDMNERDLCEKYNGNLELDLGSNIQGYFKINVRISNEVIHV